MIGQGSHKLFGDSESGFGFRLPGWRYPLVLRADGTLAYDDYHGSWGNVADIQRLTGAYALGVAESVAAVNGWYSERVADELVIYHPDGGVLRVSAAGVVDTSGFLGADCQSASAGIEAALGRSEGESFKSEFFGRKNLVRVTE